MKIPMGLKLGKSIVYKNHDEANEAELDGAAPIHTSGAFYPRYLPSTH